MKIGVKIVDGLEEFLLSDVLPPEYTDITSVNNFIKVGAFEFKDYKWVRSRLKELDFNSLSDADKITVCKFKASTEDNCKLILGDDFDFWMTDFDLKSTDCRKVRFSVAKTILIKNISLPGRFEVLGFLNTTDLEKNYVNYGIEGISEGDLIEGLFDFVESTGSFALTGVATRTLTMIGTISQADMVAQMMDCLRNGNY